MCTQTRRPSRVRAVLRPDPRGVPVDVAGERLLAVVDDLHRPVGVSASIAAWICIERSSRPPNAPPTPARWTRTCSGESAEARRDLVAVDVEPLRRDVDVDAALAVRYREPGLGAEERLVLAAELVHALDGDVARDVRVAVTDHDRADDVRARVVAVAVAHRRAVGVERLLLGRPLGVDDGLERLVLDDDRLGRAARLLRVLRRDERDGLAVVADAVDREHRLVGELEPVGLAPGTSACVSTACTPGIVDGLRDVDRDDAGVRVRAPQRVAPQHPGGAEVARVGELALDLRRPVRPRGDPRESRPRAPSRRRLGRRHARAAARTASKIFW